MTDPNVVQQPTWLTYILGVLVGLIGWIGEIYRRRVDKIDENHISREEFQRYMDQVREDRLEMHQENLGRLDRIGDDMDRIHSRIDLVLRER